MIIKTNGFKMPNGDVHTFVPPSPTESERGGIKAKAKTTESLEVAFDETTERLYAATPVTDKSLSKSDIAADAKTTGDRIETKLDKNQGVEHSGKALVIGEDGNVTPGEIQSSGEIINTASGEVIAIGDSTDRKIKGFRMTGKTEQVQTTGKNLFDPNIGYDDLVWIRNDGEIVGGANARTSVHIPVEQGKYAFQFDVINSNQMFVAGYDADGAFVKIVGIISKGKGTINIDDTSIKTIRVSYTRDSTRIQLELSETPTTYEPYTGGKPSPSPEYPQEIKNVGKWNEEKQKYEVDVKVTGKNLFDREKAKDISNWTTSACGAGFAEIAVYVCAGSTVTVSNNTKINGPLSYYYGVALKSSEDFKYYICYPGYPNSKDTFTFTATEDYIYVRCNKTSLNDVIGVSGGLQIEIGAIRTEYQPYKEQLITLTSDRPITKWDKLVEQDGEIGWLYRSEIITLTGDEHYVAYSDFDSFYTSIPALNRNGNTPFCNKYVNKSITSSNLDKVFSVGDGSRDKVWFRDMRFNLSISDFKSYLQDEYSKGTPVEVVCTTEETEFIPLPKEEQEAIRAMATYYPSTTLTNDQGCPMELDYVADTKNFILGQVSNLQKLLVNINAQLI